MEIYTVEGEQIRDSRELLDYLESDDLIHSVKTAFEALEKKKKENKRDWELLQLSKHITQLREEFNDPVSLKLLEATLETNAMLVREDYE